MLRPYVRLVGANREIGGPRDAAAPLHLGELGVALDKLFCAAAWKTDG